MSNQKQNVPTNIENNLMVNRIYMYIVVFLRYFCSPPSPLIMPPWPVAHIRSFKANMSLSMSLSLPLRE